MALHQDIRVDWRQPPASFTCLPCAVRADGILRPNNRAQNIPAGARIEHDLSARHLNYLGRFNNLAYQGPLALPHYRQNAVLPPVAVYRCIVCSTSPTGYRRHRHTTMAAVNVPSHVASGDHNRRAGDGRMQLYLLLHPRQGMRVPGLDAF